jgi:DNA-binding transcriptional MerR regulator
MTIDTNDMLKSILESISRIDYIHPGDIPNIDLYMDQVTTFMDAQLASTKRYDEDKILTKTMINNYAKNNLLPPPVKKKYTKEHVLVLIFIYYFKNILSIKDIEAILKPITDHSFSAENSIDMTALYEEICAMEKEQIKPLQDEIKRAYERAEQSFENAETDDKGYLQLFSFICSLSFDVYVKKLLIEKIIDELKDNNEKPTKK